MYYLFIKNNLMKKFHYTFCKSTNKNKVKKFISDNWKKNHILAENDILFDWQYINEDGNYNFVLAIEESEIIGLLGFIPPNKYSNQKNTSRDYWLALWTIKEGATYPGLGIGMISYLKSKCNIDNIYTVGLSNIAVQIYKSLKYNVSYLKHYVLINSQLKDAKIINLSSDLYIRNKSFIKSDCSFTEVYNNEILNDDIINSNNLFKKNTYKDKDYLINKYIKHPFYKYRFFLIKLERLECIVVIRMVKALNSSALRIVECFGNCELVSKIGTEFDKILIKENHEYLDFVQRGVDEQIFQQSGFIDVEDQKGLIVPNYFEPFNPSNKKIYFAYKNFSGLKSINFKPIIFKGDGDQDRPNQLT